MKIIHWFRSKIWIAGAIIAFLQAPGFVSFIWEETLQSQGYAVKIALDAKDCDVARDCLKRFKASRSTASWWQSHVGWLCLWMHASYSAYFDSAAVAQVAAYESMIQNRCCGSTTLAGTISVPTPEVQPVSLPAKKNDSVSVWTNVSQEFWREWRTNKAELKAQGYSVRKTNNTWILIHRD